MQYSGWIAGQLVTAAQMLSCSNDLYQRFSDMFMDRPLPYIVEGLDISSINGTGLATVTAGFAIDESFTTSEAPYLPGTDLGCLGELVSPDTIQVTSAGAEFGMIVLRQTITPTVSGQTNYTINSALVYVPGTSTAYPAVAKHDIPLAGVITSGVFPALSYTLDLTVRALDEESYVATVKQVSYLQNGSFDNWALGAGPFTIAAGGATEIVADAWSVQNNGVVNSITSEQYVMTTSDYAVVPGSPTYGLQVERLVAEASNNWDEIIQNIPGYRTLNGKYVIFPFSMKSISTSNLSAEVAFSYDSGTLTPVVLDNLTQPLTILSDSAFHNYAVAVAIPTITTAPTPLFPNFISVRLRVPNNLKYEIFLASANLCSGKYSTPVYAPPITRSFIGAQATGSVTAVPGDNLPHQIVFTTSAINPQGSWSSNEYTVPVTGVYRVSAITAMNAAPANQNYYVSLFVDGIVSTRLGQIETSFVSDIEVTGSGLIFAVAGSVFDLRAFNTGPTAVNTSATQFDIDYVGS